MPHKPIPREQPAGDHVEEVLAMVAHELRRPLTALLGWPLVHGVLAQAPGA